MPPIAYNGVHHVDTIPRLRGARHVCPAAGAYRDGRTAGRAGPPVDLAGPPCAVSRYGRLRAADAWPEALDDPGAGQMRHLKVLMLSRP